MNSFRHHVVKVYGCECVCVCVYYVWASWSSSSPCLPMWYLARSFLVTSPITCRGERERGREHQNDWCCSYLQRSLRKETTWNVCFRAANWYYFSVFQIISKTHWQTLASYMKKMEGNIDRCVQNLKKKKFNPDQKHSLFSYRETIC